MRKKIALGVLFFCQNNLFFCQKKWTPETIFFFQALGFQALGTILVFQALGILGTRILGTRNNFSLLDTRNNFSLLGTQILGTRNNFSLLGTRNDFSLLGTRNFRHSDFRHSELQALGPVAAKSVIQKFVKTINFENVRKISSHPHQTC